MSTDLIKAIAIELGLTKDITVSLYVPASPKEYGEWTMCNDKHILNIAIGQGVEYLAHELRHAYQCEALGLEVFNALYEVESLHEGYKWNVLEIDAREYGTKWLTMSK